ncbi:MAG: DUF7230 family protein [Nitrososphaeraceae archaeon]
MKNLVAKFSKKYNSHKIERDKKNDYSRKCKHRNRVE